MEADSEPSYIDYETFLDPDFSPISFANTLVAATNNASDTPLDLSTPLSRVLFDVQEIDTHIHTLTTKSALPLLTYTKEQAEASQRIAKEVEDQVASLTEGYQRLEKEVIQRFEAAEEVRIAVSRLWHTVKIGRAVGRCLLLGRQLEAQMAEFKPSIAARKEDHKAMIRAANTLLTLRQLFAAAGPDEEGEHLSSIRVVQTLQIEIIVPSEQKLRSKAQQTVREFSLSSLVPPPSSVNLSAPTATTPTTPTTPTYTQSEETKSRTTSACLTLYLLSPVSTSQPNSANHSPALLLTALQTYIQTALTSSLASIARALAALPNLPRALTEISARCQNIAALETLLSSIPPPAHPSVHSPPAPTPVSDNNLLLPLLSALDTGSLPSFFWRSLASGISGRVVEILNRGGASARSLRNQRERVKENIREAVLKGVEGTSKEGGWEREVGVMVGSVVGPLGR